MTKQQLTFLDLFSGVGGFRLGLEKAGHRCIGFCEIDAKARESYKAIHNTENEVEMHDITTISDEFVRGIGRVDIIAGGFPCQAFSVAGKRKGFRDTRGTLFFEIARFAHILQPKYLFLENVKGLLNHDSGATFETILRTLDELGYNVEWQVLNSKNYVPQNRERVFIIGRLRGASTNQIFPITGEESQINFKSAKINSKGRKQQVVGNVNPSARGMNGNVFSSDAISPKITCNNGEGSKIMVPTQSKTTQVEKRIIVEGLLDNKFRSSSAVVSVNGLSPTLTTMGGGGQEPKILVREATKEGYSEAGPGDSINFAFPNSKKRRGRVGKKYAHTLLTGDQQAVVTEDFQIRRLTPMECWRLQAFPDEAFLAAKFGSRKIAKIIIENKLDHYHCEYEQKMSDSSLYKQAGNSVTVAVIYDIAKRF